MKALIAIVAVMLMGVAGGVFAASVDEKTESFIKDVAKCSLGEVELSRFVLDKTQNPEVKKLAQHMIDDHTKANASLKDLSERLGVSTPTPMTQEQMELKDRLAKLDGKDFDREFVFFTVKEHKDAINKLEGYVQSGTNEDVKAFAQNTLPALKDHLAMAQDMARSFRGTAMADEPMNRPVAASYEQRTYDRPANSYVSYDRPARRNSYSSSSDCATCQSHSSDCGTCHTCSSCDSCEPWEDIVYENDWRAGETDYVTGEHKDLGECAACDYWHDVWH